MCLLLLTRDHYQRFAEIDTRVPGRMGERHEHLPLRQLSLPHVIFHNCVTGRKSLLFAQPLEDSLRAMPLLAGSCFIFFQNLIDDSDPRSQLRSPDRLPPL